MKRLFTFFATLILCATAISFQSCNDGKYTVWTETDTYAQFQTTFNATLEDGHYVKTEISNALWEQVAPSLTNEGKHRWSESEIRKWMIGCGFGDHESTKESSWLVMTNHGLLAARDGNLVYLILK